MEKEISVRKKAVMALKIAIGSFIAIYIAEMFGLNYAASAGIVSLLTMMSTRLDTLKLSLLRIVTFGFSTAVAVFLFPNVTSAWYAFGIYIFIIVFVSCIAGLQSTISVNAVIGTHYLSAESIDFAFVMNEFSLVVIGIIIAMIINQFHPNASQKKELVKGMRTVEAEIQQILEELTKYLRNHPFGRNVWDDIISLEALLSEYIEEAYEYQNNTYAKHTSYYVHYFEMRMKQMNVLHSLHYEMKKIRHLPVQAEIIAKFIDDIIVHVHEMTEPKALLEEVVQLIEESRQGEPPKTMEEFESRAMLYHILMDLEEFLVFKRRFIDSLADEHHRVYRSKNVEKV